MNGQRLWEGISKARSAKSAAHGHGSCCAMNTMLEIPTKAEERETRVDPRLAEVVRIIVEHFGGDVRAYLDSIRPKTEPESHRIERREHRLVEAAAMGS